MPAATLTTDCLGQCDAHVPCLVSAGDCAVQCFPDAYTSWGFEFLVPFGSYRSAAEVAERAKQSDDAFDARVAALPNDTAGHAAAGNDALSLLGTLAVPANLTGMAVYGGPSTTGYVRGKVAGVRLAESSTFVADASEMTLLSLENLELGPQLADVFADKLPTGLTDLYLRNNALESFALSAPEEQLPKLRTLYVVLARRWPIDGRHADGILVMSGQEPRGELPDGVRRRATEPRGAVPDQQLALGHPAERLRHAQALRTVSRSIAWLRCRSCTNCWLDMFRSQVHLGQHIDERDRLTVAVRVPGRSGHAGADRERLCERRDRRLRGRRPQNAAGASILRLGAVRGQRQQRFVFFLIRLFV